MGKTVLPYVVAIKQNTHLKCLELLLGYNECSGEVAMIISTFFKKGKSTGTEPFLKIPFSILAYRLH